MYPETQIPRGSSGKNKTDPASLLVEAGKSVSVNKKNFSKLKKKSPRLINQYFHDLHNEVFVETDCLACANCCLVLGPRVTQEDIDRIAGKLRLKPAAFIDKFLKTDEDNDFVFKTMPCPFLMSDNYCSVYETRPEACRAYPHTNENRLFGKLDIIEKNTLYCPAVFQMVKKLKNKFFS